jgi:hypothetical protein
MPIRLTAEDAALLDRIEALLHEGTAEYLVAEELGFTRHKLTTFLADCGFGVETKRRLIRLGSGEPYAHCRETGVIVVETTQDAVPV